MEKPTLAQVFGALAAAEVLPSGTDFVSYATRESVKYDRALDVLAVCGWLPDPTDREHVETFGITKRHENVLVELANGGTMTLSSPIGHTPFTDTPFATPIERLAEPPVSPSVVMRVGDVVVEIEGPQAEAIRDAVAQAVPDAAESPLPSRGVSRDAQIIEFPGGGRGRQDGPRGRGA